MKKPIKVLLIIVGAIVALLLIVVIGANVYFQAPVKEYYKASDRAFVIPEIHKGFIPQGIDYDQETGYFFITGYTKGEESSPVYVLDQKTGKLVSKTSIKNTDGSNYMGHAGGIAVQGDYVYIAGGGDACLYVLNKADVISGSDQKIIGSFNNKESEDDYIGSAFVFTNEGQIILGEFYREVSYPTLDSHKLTTTGGDYNQAVAVVYDLDDSAEFGIAPEPVMAISLPDLAQGMAIVGDDAYVSMSWGTAKSVISKYSLKASEHGKTIDLLGKTLPLLEFDNLSLVSSQKLAAMSEEIEIVEGKMYVMCESASNKYFFGKLTGGQYCFSTDIDFWN